MAKPIGELLVEAKALTREKLEEALKLTRDPGQKLGQLLLEHGYITEAHLTQCLSFQLSVPWVSLYHIDFTRQLLAKLPRDIADKYCMIPIYVRHVKGVGDTLYVAIEDPMNQSAISEASKAAGLPVRPMIASAADIRSAIRVYYDGEPAPPPPAQAAIAPPPISVPSPSTDAKKVDPAGAKPEPPPLPPRRRQPSIVDAAPAGPPGIPPIPPGMSATKTSPGSTRSNSRPPVQAVAPIPPPPPSRPAMDTLPHLPPVASETALPASEDSSPDVNGAAAHSDSPDASPELEAREMTLPGRKAARMVALTLLDGTSLALPARPRRKSEAPPASTPNPASEASPPSAEGAVDQLTSRDLISALRALSHGADVSDILGEKVHWESHFAALLSLLLKKGLIADWEFIEELRKI